MRLKHLFIILLFCISGPALWAEGYRTPFSVTLEKQIQQLPGMTQEPGTARLQAMRYYVLQNTVPQTPGIFNGWFDGDEVEEAQIRAFAFYLVNMYVSAAAYREDMPTRLTLDYVGALDGFMRVKRMFKLSKAEQFYTKHQVAIQTYVKENFKQAGLPPYTPGDENAPRERAFANLLANTSSRHNRPYYQFSGVGPRMPMRAPQAAVEQVTAWLRTAQQDGKNKVITFEQAAVRPEDLDTPHAPHRPHVECTYRCVNEECAYSTYVLGQTVCRAVANAQGTARLTRVYKLTAYPARGEFITPATGGRFVLADGQQAPPWNYHTATLVEVKVNNRYALLVADPFLAGDTPVALGVWLTHFSPTNTVFTAEPFVRSQTVEDALKTPQRRNGRNVVVDGKTYTPYPVLK